MGKRGTSLGLLFAMLALTAPVLAAAADPHPALNATFAGTIAKLDREPQLAQLIHKEYGTQEAEIQWAADQSLSWGEITALAYIQATTGKSFAELIGHDARRDFWAYAENAGMSCEKMTHSLERLLKRAERERNSRIFEQLRASRRIYALPDLGSGFGLFQEALDFRHIELPQPTKEHTGAGVLAKGGK